MRALYLVPVLVLGACDEPAVILEVTAPDGSVELVPGGSIDLGWTLSGGEAEVVIDAIPLGAATGPRVFDQVAPVGPTLVPWAGVDVDGVLLPPDVYDLVIGAVVDGEVSDPVTRTVTVHGIEVTDPAPGDTVTATTGYDLAFTTVSMRPLDLTISLVGAQDHAVHTMSIGGEFVPFARAYHFDGTDVAGAPVPAGAYTVAIDATDGADVAYRVEGGTLDWQP